MWTTATHQEGYDKKKWKDLQGLIQKWAIKMRDNGLFENKITEQNVLVDKEINCNNNCFKIGDPQLKFNVIHDEKIVGSSTTKQYLIDECNEHFNRFVVDSIIYDYEKHMSMKWVNASEYNKIALNPLVCDCCWKEIPTNEHRILYEAAMTERPNQYHVCFECHDKLQKMPHGKCDISKSIGKIQNEGPLASQPVPIIDKKGRMEDHKDFDEMALLDEFIERVKEKDLTEQIKELETAGDFISEHLVKAKAESIVTSLSKSAPLPKTNSLPLICTKKDSNTQIGCITSIENKSGNRIGAYCFYGIKITCTISEIPERDNNLFIRDWFYKKTLSPKKNLYMNFDSKWHIIKGCFVSEIKDKTLTIICDSIEECKEETKFVDSSFVKVYDHALSYDEIVKEFEKSKEEAKDSEKYIVIAKQHFPTATLKRISQATEQDWREAWYDRYDDE